MKLKKRALLVVTAMSVMVSMFSGCNKQEASNSGVTTVTIWSGDASKKEAWTELTKEWNDTIGKEKNIRIEWTFSSDHYSKIDIARQNGQMPDITSLSYVQEKEYAMSKDIIPLEDVEGLSDFVNNYNTVKLRDRNIFDGKMYTIMNTADVSGLIYNKDLFKEAGIVDEKGEAKPPKTVKEMREYAKKLTDTENNIYGYSFPLKFSTFYTLNTVFTSSFGDMAVLDYDKLTYDGTPMLKALQVMLDMRNDGSLFPGAESLDNDTSRAYFAEGKIAMMPGMLWDVGVLTSQFVADCDWGVAPYPVVDENDVQPAWTEVGGVYCVTKDGAEKAEAVAEVYKFLYGEDAVNYLYEKGLQIPWAKEMLRDDVKSLHPQFEQFNDIIDSNYVFRLTPSLKLEGDSRDVVFSKVWSGDMTIDEAIKDINKRYSEALKKGVENGEIDLEFFKEEAAK